MSKQVICRDCEVEFELPVKRGRPAVRCEPCRSKTSTVTQFSQNGVVVERKVETIDGVKWVENAEPCEGCSKTFQRPVKRGRPPKKCQDCVAWDEAEKASTMTTPPEVLEELFSGDPELLNGTPDELPKGAEAQCPPPRGCGRIWTSNSACDEHKVFGPDGNLQRCKDPASLGHEPRERRNIPVWTRPSAKEVV